MEVADAARAVREIPIRTLAKIECSVLSNQYDDVPGTPAPFLAAIEPSLDADDLSLLTTGAATGCPQTSVLPDADTRIRKLNKRSRDNFPNPKVEDENPYVPVNSPALGDLFDMFRFERDREHER